MTVDPRLLDLLACPVCRAAVRLEGERLICTQCQRRYPIRDGILVMLPEQAEPPPSMPAKPTDG